MMTNLFTSRKLLFQIIAVIFALFIFSDIQAKDLNKRKVERSELASFNQYVYQIPEPVGGLSSITEKIAYPEIAGRARVQGDVYVRVFVDEAGNVIDAEIVKGLSGGCNEAVLNAVIDTKFNPAVDNGVPVRAQTVLRVKYRLR